MEESELQEFRQDFHWKDYSCATYSFLAYQRPDGLYPLVAQIVLQVQEPGPGWADATRGAGFLAARGTLSVGDVQGFLSNPFRPAFVIGDYEISLVSAASARKRSWSHLAYYDRPWGGFAWPCSVFRGNVDGMESVVQPLRWRRVEQVPGRLDPRPFSSLAQLARWLGDGVMLNSGQLCSYIDIVAPQYARIRETELVLDRDGGRVTRTLIETHLDPTVVPMAILVSRTDASKAPAVVPGTAWTARTASVWTGECALNEQAGWTEAFLTVRGFRVDRGEAAAPSLPIQVLSVLSGGNERLAQHQRGEFDASDPSRHFESQMVELLSLAQIPTVDLHGVKGTSLPDFVAFPDRDQIVVAECTTNPTPPKAKMRNLRARAEDIRVGCRLGERHPDVLPVMFLPGVHTNVTQEVQDLAAELGICLLWGAAIRALAEQILAGEGPGQVWRFLCGHWSSAPGVAVRSRR